MTAAAPAVRRYLDLSTAHLPRHLAVEGLGEVDGVVAYRLEYGWLMTVPTDADAEAAGHDGEVPAEVLAIQRYARERGCDRVLFDADADTVDGLPTWEW